jgi:hypothetical protein
MERWQGCIGVWTESVGGFAYARASHSPQLNSICPHRFQDTFVEENFIGEGELGAAT